MVHPLFRRPLATAVALGIVAYASGLAGAWVTGTWQRAVEPVPGPLAGVHSLWAALQADGSPLPPPPATAAASGIATAATPSPTARVVAPTPVIVTPGLPQVTTLTPVPATPTPAVTVTVTVDGTPHVFNSVTFSYSWQRNWATQVDVKWTGVSGLCLRITASDGHSTTTQNDCPTGASFGVSARPAANTPNAAMTYSVSGSPRA